MAILTDGFAFEDLFAELHQASFFRVGCGLSAGWLNITRKPEEASCDSNQRRAPARELSRVFQDCANHSETPDLARATFCVSSAATGGQRNNRSRRIRQDLQ